MPLLETAAIISAGVSLLSLGIGGAQNWNANKQRKANAKNSYLSALDNANQYMRQAEDLYNQTYSGISNTYGSDVASILEGAYNEINGIGSKAVTRRNLTQYGTSTPSFSDIMKDPSKYLKDSASPTADFDYSYENHGLSSTQLGDSSTDSSFAGRLYNLLSTGDSALAQQLRLSGNQMAQMLGQAFEDSIRQITLERSTSQYYAQQMRSQNISDAQTIAQAQAQSATSGFRGSNANEHLAALQADMNRAAYAFQMRNQAMQLQSSIQKAQKSSSLSAYEANANMEIAKRRELESLVNQYAQGTKGAEQQMDNARNEVEKAQEHKNEYKDAEDANFLERLLGFE